MYELDDATVRITYRVENKGEDTMYFGLGGHPGFRLPLEEGKCFEDYRLTFAQPSHPDRALLSPAYQMSGVEERYPLENDTTLHLRHDLFDDDAIFLSRADSAITLKSDKTNRFVKVTYADMPYVGIWHKPQMVAPYVCIEPWCGLPGNDGVIEDMEFRADMFRIQPGSTKKAEFSMIFG
jgi:galactose mutarotase-like enzyme